MKDYVINYVNSLHFELRASKIHGVGLFSICNISVDSNVFPIWNGDTSEYSVPIKKIKPHVLEVIKKYFPIVDDKIKILLIQNFCFWFPWRIYTNTHSKFNITSDGIALYDIKKNDEILLKTYFDSYSEKPNKIV